jgi:DNA-binding CsgD family transcriptional regulator/tetratricopeptide (TPR) repeat protein
VISRRVSPVLVGRETELEALMGVFGEAADGTPGTVLLGAEAGGGKSRLVAEFTERVRDRALVLAGGCVNLGGAGLPYEPFTAMLRDLVRQRGAGEVAALLPDRAAGELARLLPEFGRPPADGDPEMSRARLFGLVLALLERLAGERPLVLVIEDVHWGDRSTGELIAFLIRNLRQAPVLAVVTFRSEELDRVAALRRLVADLGRMDGVMRLQLARLSRGQVAAQLEGMLGRPAAPVLADAVYQRGGGNPLFTEALVDADGVVSAGLPVPLRELLFSRIKELPEQAQRVLRAAAMGCAHAGHRLLASVTGLSEMALDDVLRPALASSVLVAEEGGYAFRHELFREALLADLLPGERVQAHRAFAEALQADPSLLSPGRRLSAPLALHWHGAGEHQRALRAAWAAAADAGAALAYAEQLQMLELTLELWDRAPEAARLVGAERAEVIEAAAGAARLTGAAERGLALVEAGLGELDEARDPERVASLLRLRADFRQQLLLPGYVDDLRAALRLASAPTRVRAQVLSQLGATLQLRYEYVEAERLADQLQELAARLGDEEIEVEASIRVATVRVSLGHDTIADLRAAAEQARRIGAGRSEVDARADITYALERLGRHDAAVRAGREDLARARRLGLSRLVTASIAYNLAESLISAGSWDEALEVLHEALGLDPAPLGREFLLVLRGQIAAARGEQAVTAEIVAELGSLRAGAQVDREHLLLVDRLMIEYRLAGGDLTGALAAAGTVTSWPAGSDPRYLWPLLAAAMQVCADAAVAGPASQTGPAGMTGDLAALRDELARRAASTPQPGPVERAHAAVFTAEASRARGHLELAAWDAAAVAWEAVGQPYPLAYARLRAADAAAAGGERDAAAARLTQAAELAARLGARPLLQQITRLARRARIDLPPAATGQAGPAVPFGLTAREIEVLRLVTIGLNNPQIAAELFISPKTASVHVSNILGKLGVASRTEAAATVYRLHLFDAG